MGKKQEKTKKTEALAPVLNKGLAEYNKKQRELVKQRKATLMTALQESDRHFVRELAQILGISRRSANRLLQDNQAWLDFRKKSKQTLDTSAIKVMRALLQALEEKSHRLAPSQMGILLGILYDKTFPASVVQPLAQIDVSKDKKIVVYYPNFKPPEEESE